MLTPLKRFDRGINTPEALLSLNTVTWSKPFYTGTHKVIIPCVNTMPDYTDYPMV